MDHHFPRYHARPPKGFANDPNGPVVIDSRVHIYHQFRTALDGNSPVSWAHASTDDLVRWQYHRPAMAPEPGGLDADGAWSGNTVWHDGVLTAFYSGFVEGKRYQSVLAADSTDKGYSFGPPRLIVEDPTPEENIHTYRDPFVWRTQDGWALIVGTGNDDSVAAARMFTSPDLVEWTPAGNLASAPRHTIDGVDTGEMWECPQVLEVDGETVLFPCAWTRAGGITRVLSVHGKRTPGGPIEDPVMAPYDLGTNFYASSALPGSIEGPLLWGWSTEGRDQSWVDEAGWTGILSLPRRISIVNGKVHSAPVVALKELRTCRIEPDDRARYTLPSEQFEFQAELPTDSSSREITLRFSDEERLTIQINGDTGRIVVDRSEASTDPRADTSSATINGTFTEGSVQLSGYVDGSILELFTNDGQVATVRFYPLARAPWELELSSQSPRDQVEVWSLSRDGGQLR